MMCVCVCEEVNVSNATDRAQRNSITARYSGLCKALDVNYVLLTLDIKRE